MKGIDVSYAQGKIDWASVKAAGVDFVMIKASQGRLVRDADSGSFRDPRFEENIIGAHRAGLQIGVYHYLTARDLGEALEEAAYFLSVITPHRDKITLWAACDAEEDRYLPKSRTALTNTVHGFLRKVAAGGFAPMLYSNPNYLKYRLGDVSGYPLWLAYWGTTEARALAYAPKIWQYGTAYTAGVRTRVDQNRGYFTLPAEKRENGRKG